jgi:hypothetical protein
VVEGKSMPVSKKTIVVGILAFLSFSAMASDPFEVVRKWGESDTHAVRWVDGSVLVYDATNSPHMSKVLELLNRDLVDVRLVMANTPENANIKVQYGETQDACGLTTVWTQPLQRTITGAEIQLSPSVKDGKCKGNSDGAAVLLHEMTHAVGFSRHTTQENTLMHRHVNVNMDVLIPPEQRLFLQALYSIPAGILIPSQDDEFKPEVMATQTLAQILGKSDALAPVAMPTTKPMDLPVEDLGKYNIAKVDAQESRNTPIPMEEPIRMDPKTQVIEFGPKGTSVTQMIQASNGIGLEMVPLQKGKKSNKMPIQEFKAGAAKAAQPTFSSGFEWGKVPAAKARGKAIF